jgi:hypothetical protein
MAKFKVGDRVVFRPHGYSYAARPGAQAIVTSIDSWLRISWDRTVPGSEGQKNGGYNEDDFELFAPPVKTDEEIANEYRQARKNCKEMNEELRRRGWTVGGSGDNITVKKTVTTVMEI